MLLCGTWEPVVLMLREKLNWKFHKSKNINAKHRGGTNCISDEVSVMNVELRG